MSTARGSLVLACLATLSLAGCSGNSSSTTSPSATPADASISESFTATVPVGGAVFYSFSMPQYGNVAVTLTTMSGTDLPDDQVLGLGVGRPSGTSCIASSTVSAGAGGTAQLTGVFGPGVYCVRVYDTGTLPGAVSITATVAHS